MKKVTHLPKAVNFMLKGMALFIGLCFLNPGKAFSQGAVVCPPNIDFSMGDFTNWACFYGTAYEGSQVTPTQPYTTMAGSTATSPPIPTSPIAGRFDITSGTAQDPIWLKGVLAPAGGSKIPFPIVCPAGGPYSLKLGDTTAGAKANRVIYQVHVPVGMNDYSFNYRFACVLEDPGHPTDAQPLFQITAYDSALNAQTGGGQLGCLPPPYIASAALVPLGFKTVLRNGYSYDTVRVLPWTGAAIPLLGVGGKTITIEVTALDCAYGGHFGYGYFDVISCGKYKAAVSYCNLDSGIVRFIGTGVTQVYNWFDKNWNPVGTGTFIDVPVPSTPTWYYGVLASNTPGCLDTIATDTVSNFLLNTTPKTPCVQFGKPIQIVTTPVGGLPGGTYTYAWSGPLATTLSCITCNNPTALPYDTTTYYVTVTDRIGCSRNDTVQVFQAPNAGPDLKVCPLGERPAQLHVAGPPNASFHWYDYPTNNAAQYLTCNDCPDPLSAPEPSSWTYTVGYDGCPVRDTLIVYHDTTNYMVTPQDLIIQCRPGYRNLLSEAKGPFPKLNIACGIGNPISCTTPDTAIIGNPVPGTPPKVQTNTPFLTTNNFIKYQFIIKKQDLLYAGLYSGTINTMSFKTLGSLVKAKGPIDYMFVSLGCIDQNDFPTPTNNNSFYGATALTPVATISNYTLTANAWNDITFDSPYSWDTTKNLLVDICVGPLSAPDTGGKDVVAMEEGVAIQKYSTTINVCGGNVNNVYRYLQRPTVRFYYCATPDLPFQYTWVPGNNLNDSTIQNPTAYIPRSQNYAVYSVGRNGCRIRDSLHIVVPDHHVSAGPNDSSICKGQPGFLYAYGAQAYKWYEVHGGTFSDASGSLSCTACQFPVATPTQTTTYAIVFSNEVGAGNPSNPEYATGCPDTTFITLNVWNLPNVAVLNPDTTITIGQSVPLYVQGAQYYSWSPVNGLNDPNAPMTLAHPTATTTYVATGYDMHGCAYSDTVKISVNYHTNLLIPSGFTPNGDGLNDVFKIVNPQVQRLLEFRVFNRWGQEVFSTTDINQGWDGTWKGVKQEVGTYKYIIRVGYADKTQETYKGDVELIK
jgi:gliding motility-associated-like protein